MVSTRSSRAPMSTRCMRSRLLNEQRRAADRARPRWRPRRHDRSARRDRRRRRTPRAAVLRAAVADCRDMRSAGRSPTTSDTTRPIAARDPSTRQFERHLRRERHGRQQRNGDPHQHRRERRRRRPRRAAPSTSSRPATGRQCARAMAPSATRTAISLRRAALLGEEQVGDVGAGNQQHQHDRTERDVDRLAQMVADQLPIERLDRDAPVLLPRGNRVGDLRSHGEQIGVCLLQRHAALQPRNRVQPVRAGRQFLGRNAFSRQKLAGVLQWPRPMPVERARRAGRR